MSYVDLRFDDGHVERWCGAGSLRDDVSHPFPYTSVVAWGEAVIDEQQFTLLGELGMSFFGVHRGMLDQAPTEIVVEWGAELPILPEPNQLRAPHPDTSGALVFGLSEPELGPGGAGADSPAKSDRGSD
jgi:hypothetical protein